jgi:hypothetical protein
MIIWRGLGILVGVAGFIGFLLAELVTRSVTNDEAFYQAHSWPRLLGAVLAASLAYGMVKILEKSDKPKIVIEKDTGRELELCRRDSLFFVPVKYWPYIFFVIGVIVAFIPQA